MHKLRYLEKAATLLASGDEDDLIYACLELRKSLEAYSYDLLSRYMAEAPFRLITKTWQADKVIKELVAIDPKAGSSSTLRIKRDATATESAGAWKVLGEDRRLPAKDVRTYYQALGNFLHTRGRSAWPMASTTLASPTDQHGQWRQPVSVQQRDVRAHPVRSPLPVEPPPK